MAYGLSMRSEMMDENYLAQIFEFNNWANQQIIKVCLTLSDEQLDAPPMSATYGSIRETLLHIATSQLGYLRELTLPLEQRRNRLTITIAEVEQSMMSSGEMLLAVVRDPSRIYPKTPLRTPDDYVVEPWVLMVQIINHGHEHREQIKSMLTALGITPPDMDGWMFGASLGALRKIET
jgi:uncharacterized damage-inducible protein DinB